MHGMQEVRSSILLVSTKPIIKESVQQVPFLFAYLVIVYYYITEYIFWRDYNEHKIRESGRIQA